MTVLIRRANEWVVSECRTLVIDSFLVLEYPVLVPLRGSYAAPSEQ